MMDDDLSDIDITLEPMDIYSNKPLGRLVSFGIVPVGILIVGVAAFIRNGDVPMLLLDMIGLPLLVMVIRDWVRSTRLHIDGREARLTGCEDGDTVISFGPQVTAEIRMDPEYHREAGWGGFYGMVLEEGDKRIYIQCDWPFREREVKAVWPDFVRLVRAHGMRRGPVLAKVLEMADTGEGQMVLDPRLKWRILDSPSP